MSRAKVFLLLILYFGLPIAATGIVLLSDPGLCPDPLLCAALCAGVSGYTWLMFQLLLSARIKLIERGIGNDRLLLFHRIMAPVSIVLLLVHAAVKNLYYPASVQKLSGSLAYIGFILIGIGSMILFGSESGRGLTRKIRHLFFETWKRQYQDVKRLHNFTFLLSVLIFFHVLFSSLARYYPGMRVYFIVVFLLGALSYLYHKGVRPLGRSSVYRVRSVDRPSENITTLEFEPEKGKGLNHQPGQFAFFRFPDRFPGPEEHPFTISHPEQPAITVKNLGDFTGRLGDVGQGTRVRIDGPYGVFSYKSIASGDPLVFIAGGIGITPFLSMIRGLRLEEDPRRPLLLWGVREKSDLIYLKEIEGNAVVVPVLSGQDESWTGERGRFDTELLRKFVSEDKMKSACFFICGPPAMMNTVIRSLLFLGVPKKRIIRERFSL